MQSFAAIILAKLAKINNMRILEIFKTCFLPVEVEKCEVQNFTITKMYEFKIFIRFMSVKTDSCIYTNCEILRQIDLLNISVF